MAQRGPYRKGEIKRREILLAAIDVFSRRGYRNATIREIAESVGLTQAGLFHYFTSKEELFVEVLRVRDELDAREDEGSIDTLRRITRRNMEVEGLVHLFVTISAEAIDENHPGHEFFIERYERHIEMVRTFVRSRQEDGSVTSSIEATTIARMMLAIMDGMQVQWLLDPDGTDMLEVLDAAWQLLATEVDGGPPGSRAVASEGAALHR
jgi:AcrR family transcriptional regulator